MFRGFVLGIIVVVVAAAACGFAVIETGSVPAAALNAKPLPLERWAARTSLRATLADESPKGPNPVPLTDANLIAGIDLFAQHCAICHGTAKGEPQHRRWRAVSTHRHRKWRPTVSRTIQKAGPTGRLRTVFAGPACRLGRTR